jgi:hypothetical protein
VHNRFHPHHGRPCHAALPLSMLALVAAILQSLVLLMMLAIILSRS